MYPFSVWKGLLPMVHIETQDVTVIITLVIEPYFLLTTGMLNGK